MGSGRAIALAGLMAGLVGLAPVVAVPGVAQVMAQTADQRKAEGDRLLQQGTQQYQSNKFEEALQSWQKALAVYRELKSHREEGISLENLGKVYTSLKDYAKAVEHREQSLAIFRELKDRQAEGATLNNLGNSYRDLGNYAKAIEYHESSLAIFRELKDRQTEKIVLGNLSKIADRLFEQGTEQIYAFQTQAVVQSWEQALIVYRKLQNRQKEAGVLIGLSTAYLGLGNSAKAIELSKQALVIARELNEPELEKFALQVLELSQSSANSNPRIAKQKAEAERFLIQGMQQYRASQFEAALQSFQQALPIYQTIKDRRGEGQILGNLGNVHFSLANYEKAIIYHEQRLAITREIKDRYGEGASLGNLGNAHVVLGNYEKAITYHEQGLVITRETKDYQGEGQSLSNLGIVYGSLGNYEKAITYYEQSLVIVRKIRDQLSEGQSLNNLGTSYLSLRNYEKAVAYLEKSLAIAQKVKSRQVEGLSLSNLGKAYTLIGNREKAIIYYEKGLTIAREIKDRRMEGQNLNNLGFEYYFMGDYEKSLIYQEKALAIARKIKDQWIEGASLNNLGVAQFKSGKLAAAEKVLFESIAIWESLRRAGVRNDANKVSIFEEQARSYRLLQRVLVAQKQTQVALEISERGRARAFVELLSRQLIGQSSEVKPPNLQQIQKIAWQQNATLVQYAIIYDDFKVQGRPEFLQSELYIWVIQPTGEIDFRKIDLKKLGQQQSFFLEELVEQSRETIGARGRSDIEVTLSPERLKLQQEQQGQKLKQLHQLLIEPIADLLPKDPTQRVIFMPQGELFLVPFPALLDANNKPLLEKHTILTAPSIQVLQLTRQQRQAMQKAKLNVQNVLVVGNPTMPKVMTKLGKNPVQLSNLPGAKREALEIAKLFSTQALTGAQATENAIAQQMPNARIIHLATHGLLDDTKGLGVPGAIALAPAGNGQLNDGLLTSDEILDMKLNAELVVLSACDTGRGRITGDGVIGLSRSLITAGVPSIIVSLWKVPDEPTAFLMTEFYKNLQASPNKAQALRQAMLTTKQKYPDPLNWAAFTLIGEAE